MKKLLLISVISMITYCTNAQNSFPSSGDAYMNAAVPAGHGGGYNALWMPNATALMPENSSAYAGIMLTANIIRNSITNVWGFANSTLPAWRLFLGYGPNTDLFYISRSAPTSYAEQTFFKINNLGNVLIGENSQNNPAYKLDVNGNVRANGIVVNNTGADFVFAPSYRLSSLSNLKKYIEQNHHLPEIASAKQMQVNGLNLGDNQIKLLQKVEELTLYTIAADNQIKEAKATIEEQKAKEIEQGKLLARQQTMLLELQKQLKAQQQEINHLKNQH